MSGKFIAIFCLSLGIQYTLSAQEISRQVLSSYGLVSKTNALDMSATVGELAVQLFNRNPSHILTQGFQQPDNDRDTLIFDDDLFIIYPNPVPRQGSLTIKVLIEGHFIVSIYNSIGMKTEIRDFYIFTKGQEYIIPMAKYSSGLYILHIKNTSGDISRYFKIEKIN